MRKGHVQDLHPSPPVQRLTGVAAALVSDRESLQHASSKDASIWTHDTIGEKGMGADAQGESVPLLVTSLGGCSMSGRTRQSALLIGYSAPDR